MKNIANSATKSGKNLKPRKSSGDNNEPNTKNQKSNPLKQHKGDLKMLRSNNIQGSRSKSNKLKRTPKQHHTAIKLVQSPPNLKNQIKAENRSIERIPTSGAVSTIFDEFTKPKSKKNKKIKTPTLAGLNTRNTNRNDGVVDPFYSTVKASSRSPTDQKKNRFKILNSLGVFGKTPTANKEYNVKHIVSDSRLKRAFRKKCSPTKKQKLTKNSGNDCISSQKLIKSNITSEDAKYNNSKRSKNMLSSDGMKKQVVNIPLRISNQSFSDSSRSPERPTDESIDNDSELYHFNSKIDQNKRLINELKSGNSKHIFSILVRNQKAGISNKNNSSEKHSYIEKSPLHPPYDYNDSPTVTPGIKWKKQKKSRKDSAGERNQNRPKGEKGLTLQENRRNSEDKGIKNNNIIIDLNSPSKSNIHSNNSSHIVGSKTSYNNNNRIDNNILYNTTNNHQYLEGAGANGGTSSQRKLFFRVNESRNEKDKSKNLPSTEDAVQQETLVDRLNHDDESVSRNKRLLKNKVESDEDRMKRKPRVPRINIHNVNQFAKEEYQKWGQVTSFIHSIGKKMGGKVAAEVEDLMKKLEQFAESTKKNLKENYLSSEYGLSRQMSEVRSMRIDSKGQQASSFFERKMAINKSQQFDGIDRPSWEVLASGGTNEIGRDPVSPDSGMKKEEKMASTSKRSSKVMLEKWVDSSVTMNNRSSIKITMEIPEL